MEVLPVHAPNKKVIYSEDGEEEEALQNAQDSKLMAFSNFERRVKTPPYRAIALNFFLSRTVPNQKNTKQQPIVD